MNDQKEGGGAGFNFQVGREVKTIREDCPPGKASQSRGGRVGRRYHEPSVPHIYSEASVVHRFHRMLLSLGKDCVSLQLSFGCFAIDRPSSRSFPVHSLHISDTQGRTRWEGFPSP
ncbi:unnamed protein product [Brassica oleracea]